MLKADKALYEKCLDTPGFAYWFNRAAVPPVVFVAAALPLPEVTK